MSQIHSNTLKYMTNTFRYAIDTRITAESDLGPGMVNVFGVEYGFNSVREPPGDLPVSGDLEICVCMLAFLPVWVNHRKQAPRIVSVT